MQRKRVLLLVPPADRLYIRDYYCSFSSKAGYYWPPQDLVVLSGNLSKMFEVRALDAIALRMRPRHCLGVVSSNNFDLIISATGSATLSEDINFLKLIKENNPSTRIMVSSSMFISIGKEVLNKFHFLDAALLDFTNNDAANFLLGEYENIKNMLFRENHRIIERYSETGHLFSMMVPRHELFLNKRCKVQLFNDKPFITTISSVGCPYQCSFCCARTLKFRIRKVGNILQEVEHVYNNLGIRNVFFVNPILFGDKGYARGLFEGIIKAKLKWVNWIANVRADLLDDDLVNLMRLAGCKGILFGIESGTQGILDKYRKGISLEKCKQVSRWCKKSGILTLAYFIMGFPEEDRASLQRTIDFARECDSDFISTGFATPDIGTDFRGEMLQDGSCPVDFLASWDSTKYPCIKNSSLTYKELIAARKKMYRNFYLRPSWITSHIGKIHLIDFIKGGLTLLRN